MIIIQACIIIIVIYKILKAKVYHINVLNSNVNRMQVLFIILLIISHVIIKNMFKTSIVDNNELL